MFCAIEDGKMVAKGQVGIMNVIPPGRAPNCKHHIYVNLKAVPHREQDYDLLDELYQVLYERAVVLMRTLPKAYETYLCVGNYAHESANNAFYGEEGVSAAGEPLCHETIVGGTHSCIAVR